MRFCAYYIVQLRITFSSYSSSPYVHKYRHLEVEHLVKPCGLRDALEARRSEQTLEQTVKTETRKLDAADQQTE